jgi:hypothetical protein
MANKTLHILFSIIILGGPSLFAQNPRLPAINLSGQIFDEYDHVLGWISKEGIVQNAMDDRIAVIDKEGNAYDGKGQRIGRMNKDGAFVDAYGSLLFTVSKPRDQHCELIDPAGKIVGIVHAQYKIQASAIHCLYTHMKIY